MKCEVHSQDEHKTVIVFTAYVNGKPMYMSFEIETSLWDSDEGGAIKLFKSIVKDNVDEYSQQLIYGRISI